MSESSSAETTPKPTLRQRLREQRTNSPNKNRIFIMSDEQTTERRPILSVTEIESQLLDGARRTYRQHGERAAMRCALGDAAALCDAIARSRFLFAAGGYVDVCGCAGRCNSRDEIDARMPVRNPRRRRAVSWAPRGRPQNRGRSNID
jgi:hypothetical protein